MCKLSSELIQNGVDKKTENDDTDATSVSVVLNWADCGRGMPPFSCQTALDGVTNPRQRRLARKTRALIEERRN